LCKISIEMTIKLLFCPHDAYVETSLEKKSYY
jgi:hypothetical protein